MARILVIDDDPALLDAVGLALEDAGHAVEGAPDGIRGLDRARAGTPDLVVCDVNMPGLDGFSLCRKLRAEHNGVPFVLLTSRDSEIDEALGLELGADDYIAKPFSTRVLLARVSALLRREELRAGARAATGTVSAGSLELDPERLEVRWSGHGVEVTVTEFRLLEALARRPGVVFSREAILDDLRGDTVVAPRLIDTYVRRLRRKFEAVDGTFDAIETVVGAGYRWKDARS